MQLSLQRSSFREGSELRSLPETDKWDRWWLSSIFSIVPERTSLDSRLSALLRASWVRAKMLIQRKMHSRRPGECCYSSRTLIEPWASACLTRSVRVHAQSKPSSAEKPGVKPLRCRIAWALHCSRRIEEFNSLVSELLVANMCSQRRRMVSAASFVGSSAALQPSVCVFQLANDRVHTLSVSSLVNAARFSISVASISSYLSSHRFGAFPSSSALLV